MKGVILRINPAVKIIDISHIITAFSVIEASYVIKTTYKHYPEKTVIIAVVDPGVGSSREILAIRTKSNHFFIGPDNGIFSNVFKKSEISECIAIQNDQFFVKPVSKTFHGRDIMAPVSAYITKGISLNSFGPTFDVNRFIEYPIPYEIHKGERKITCTIQYIDSFGNVTTNIPIKNNLIEGKYIALHNNDIIEVKTKAQKLNGRYTSYFSTHPIGSLLFLKGSTGYLEISINRGNAAQVFDLKVGDILKLSIGRNHGEL